MKKVTLILMMLVCSWCVSKAQFDLTANGLVSKENPDKDFVVLNFDGQSKADLYKNTLAYLQSLYSSANNIVKTVDGETITVTDLDNSTIPGFYNRYSFVFEFKEGKMKATPTCTVFYSSMNGTPTTYEIYKNGKLKREKDKAKLENFYNGYLAIVKKNLEKKAEAW